MIQTPTMTGILEQADSLVARVCPRCGNRTRRLVCVNASGTCEADWSLWGNIVRQRRAAKRAKKGDAS